MSGAAAAEIGVTEAAQLLYREARLLDERRFAEWLALYAPDAWYWVPSRPEQTSWNDTISIVFDDRRLMEMRVRRMAHPNAHALAPPARTAHLIGNIAIIERTPTDGACIAASSFQMIEYRDGKQLLYGGTVRHRLARGVDGLTIGWKRVDLVNADGVHEPINVIF